MQEGFDWIWKAGRLPYLGRGGKKWTFWLEHFVPHISESATENAAKLAAGNRPLSGDGDDESFVCQPCGAVGQQPLSSGSSSSGSGAGGNPSRSSPSAGPEDGGAVSAPPPVAGGAAVGEPPAGGDSQRIRDLKAIAASAEHQYSHFPKNPYCVVCQHAKATQLPARRRDPKEEGVPKEFGDLLAADHAVMKPEDTGYDEEHAALMMYDFGTQKRLNL